MEAEFKFRYGIGNNTDIDVSIDTTINSDEDKKHFLLAVAKVLGREIEVKETFAEKVFKEGDEAHE